MSTSHRVRQPLLLCGVCAVVLYAAADMIGGLLYPGYSFGSQAVSELMATGAPSEHIVDPLLLLSGVFTLALCFGMLRSTTREDRALRIAAWLLTVYTVLGFTGPTLFEIQPRGSGAMAEAAPHIVLTAILVVLTLAAMGFAASVLGERFRVYTLITIAVTVGFGVVGGTLFGARLAANQSTPGFGIIERVSIYSMLAWIAALGIALRRHPVPRAREPRAESREPKVFGYTAPGFEEVRAEFERNFAERGEIGAAVAAYWHGEKVVDLWGGRRSPDGDEPWNEDTMVVVMSTTKGLAAMTLAVAHSRGWLDYDAPVVKYWPEFAQAGKAGITVRQLLGHEAGLVLLDEKLTITQLRHLDDVARVLARQRPAWRPGTRHGYHTMTVGLYMQEIIRRVDPTHRSLGQFFHEEIAEPLGLEFYIGLPWYISDERLATLKPMSLARGLRALFYTPFAVTLKMIQPGSLLRRSFVGLSLDWNDRRSFDVEVPAGNGVGTARAIARAYSAFAEGGWTLGLDPETFTAITTPPRVARPIDEVLGLPSYFSLGFLRPGPQVAFGSSEHAFGAPGAGGSFAFADPDAHLGYAYVMNKLDFYLVDDPREKALRDAIYRAIAGRTARVGRPEPRRQPASPHLLPALSH